MKLRIGVLLLLVAAAVFMQEVLVMDLLSTVLLLFAGYVIFFWVFNFFRTRVFETALKPDTYIKMNRIAAAYSGKGSKAETASKLNAAQGYIDKGDKRGAQEQVDGITSHLEFQSPASQHKYKMIEGYLHLFEKNVRGAQKAVAKSPLDNQIQKQQKREMAFVRALLYLTQKDKTNAKEEIAKLNMPKNNRDQLLRLYAYGWYLHQTAEYEKAAQAMLPILENGERLWIAKEAKLLKQAAEAKRDYTPWTTV